MFGNMDQKNTAFERMRVVNAPDVTHLRFRLMN